MSSNENLIIGSPGMLNQPSTRRSFIRLLGLGGSVALLPSVFTACSDKSDDVTGGTDNGGTTGAVVLNLSTDVGILNYAYALEQLEAAYYTQVVSKFSTIGITDATEQQIFTDIRNHEVIHRDFLKQALGSAAIKDLSVDFGNALSSRASVIATAIIFEDLGVAAYNGAGKYLKDARNLLVAGKIVSVEARHASVLRDISDSTGRLFAGDDVVSSQGLDGAKEPAVVLAAADPFITTTVTIGTQPSA